MSNPLPSEAIEPLATFALEHGRRRRKGRLRARWNNAGYGLPPELRQLCWTHRDWLRTAKWDEVVAPLAEFVR